MLAFLGQARTVLLVLIAWCLAQVMGNLYQAPLTAVIPDRVATSRRGVASAVSGVASVVGGVVGVGIASLFTQDLIWGYLTLGLVLALTAVLFVVSTSDPSSADLPRPPRDPRGARAQLADFLSALKDHDFACVFASRAASILGYFLVVAYELYILTDYIRLPHGLRPAQGVTVLAAISAVGPCSRRRSPVRCRTA